MSNFVKLDAMLRRQAATTPDFGDERVYDYARCMAHIENVVAVVSDLSRGTSRIFNGAFADIIGLTDYSDEDSIWEKRIISMMPLHEQEEKYQAELRFFHYLKHLGPSRRFYYLMSKLRFNSKHGDLIEVLHRMYYIYEGDAVRYAVCLYGPLSIDFAGRSVAVNSLTGVSEELTSTNDNCILSGRERQVLSLIDSGKRSKEIAELLHISVHTVSRHRQEILAKLQVKNSIEACRRASSMNLI